MSNTSIDLVGLDFNSIKLNLKNYLKNNTSFKDIDFEGSNISVLLDILTYNTYLNSFYTNMVASEMFLDSAQLRDSVISHAKMLNYTPRSFLSSKADIRVGITPSSNVSNVLIPKGTVFTSKVGSNTFSFSTDSNQIINFSSGGIFSTTLEIYEGLYVTDTFVINYSNNNQRFVISNQTVDTTSLTVNVYEDNGTNILSYLRAENLFGITSDSKIFFLQAAENQQYEIIFGNNVFGRKPKDGSIIVAEYRNCNGELPNGATIFKNDGNIGGHSNVVVTTINKSYGGSINESIESIRFNAPRNYQTQNRAVTASDYELLLKSNFPEIESVSAYGGELVDPPRFGKVFIAVDIKGADGVPLNKVLTYKDFLKDRTPLSIDTVFVNPDFLYVQVVSTIKYNVNISSKLANDLKTLILSTISKYNLDYLNGFKKTLFYSKLLKEIDLSDESIVGNSTELRAIRTINPIINFDNNLLVDFGFELSSGDGVNLKEDQTNYGYTITSTSFKFNNYMCKIVDDSLGKLYIIKTSSSLAETVKETGTVNYKTGILTLNRFRVNNFEGSSIKIYAKPKSKDIYSNKNSILTIKDEDIILSMLPIKI